MRLNLTAQIQDWIHTSLIPTLTLTPIPTLILILTSKSTIALYFKRIHLMFFLEFRNKNIEEPKHSKTKPSQTLHSLINVAPYPSSYPTLPPSPLDPITAELEILINGSWRECFENIYQIIMSAVGSF